MRGDRPQSRIPSASTMRATPHARGSTLDGAFVGRLALGYPACAGIDLHPAGPDISVTRLPRMRGDRPRGRTCSPASRSATPHARGSTRPGPEGRSGPDGYPACAGIDPRRLTSHSRGVRLPRMRGDRPRPERAGRGPQVATPHARGSTCHCSGARLRRCGYPACAGIDPRFWVGWGCISRLPRMRGDRPLLLCSYVRQSRATPHARGSTYLHMGLEPGSTATPHARGSTLLQHREHLHGNGYPACAGIDPHSCKNPPTCEGLPRMRGDRPALYVGRLASGAATPHARGSTLSAEALRARIGGYPACAGIDLTYRRYFDERDGLPRMRGDRPGVGARSHGAEGATPHARGSTHKTHYATLGTIGYPACAGIDPSRGETRRETRRLPRMRGDRPPHGSRSGGERKATPHARGSTRIHRSFLRLLFGYPACAGIDPSHQRFPAVVCRLPRMRGDRPCAAGRTWVYKSATPHARGSTFAPLIAAPQAYGYPACAGIDPDSAWPPWPSRGLPRMRGDRPL